MLLNHKSTLLLIVIIITLFSSCCEGASIRLSPLGMVSVCSGGQVLLTCERISGSFDFLFWTVSIPHLAMSREVIVPRQGDISTTALQFNGLHLTNFNVTRTSDSPLTSQLLIKNVTTEINGSAIYCSENGNENGAPAVAVNVVYNGRFFNVSLVNQLLGNDSVTVTLQWPREPGAVYHINIKPEIPHNEYITNHHNIVVINLTISYNIQYNVSIISSLCGVTTTKVLKYVTCDLSSQLLNHPADVVSGSQENPHREGQFITYMCPPGFVLTGPNASVCTGNGEWEPDPGQVDCIDADCGVPVSNAKLNYSSTLEGSVLILTCENDTFADEQTLTVTCHSNGNWIPDPADFTCSSFTAAPSGTEQVFSINSSSNSTSGTTDRSSADHSLGVIVGSVLGILMIAAAAIIVAVLAILCLIKKGPKRVNRLPDIQLENDYQPYYAEQNSSEQPDPVQQDTLVYADIGPSSVKKRGKEFVTLKPDDMDDRVEYALLNHSLQKPVIATNQDSMADDSLNLDTLLIQVRGAVTPHWYQLGEALKVSKDVLDKCTNYPPEESIVEVLDQWLRNFPGRPTWRGVANALRRTGFQQLAIDIEMVYETGKFPIAVDDDNAQQVLTTTVLELPHQDEETTRMLTTFNISGQDQDESAPPLPPKPPAGSELPKKMLAPPRPPKYVAK